jgi:hypothetical protein
MLEKISMFLEPQNRQGHGDFQPYLEQVISDDRRNQGRKDAHLPPIPSQELDEEEDENTGGRSEADDRQEIPVPHQARKPQEYSGKNGVGANSLSFLDRKA